MPVRQVPLECRGHTRPVVQVTFSKKTHKGYFMMSASKDGKPMLRKGDTGDWVGTFEGHKGAIWGVALNPEAKMAATASADFTARIWDAVRGKSIVTYEHNHVVKTCDFNMSSSRLVTGGMEKILRVFDLVTPEVAPMKLSGHSASIRRAVFCGDDKVISSSEDKTVRIWDIKSSKEIKILEFPTFVYDLEVSSDLKNLTLCYNNRVAFYNLDDLTLNKEFEVPTVCYSSSLSSESTSFICAGEDFRLYRCDFNTGAQIEMYRGHFGPVHSVRFSPDGELYASASEDGTLRLWQTHLGKQYGLWKAAPVDGDTQSQKKESQSRSTSHQSGVFKSASVRRKKEQIAVAPTITEAVASTVTEAVA